MILRDLTVVSRLYRKKKASTKTSSLVSTTCTPEPWVSNYIAHICLKQVTCRAFNHHAIVHWFWQVLSR